MVAGGWLVGWARAEIVVAERSWRRRDRMAVRAEAGAGGWHRRLAPAAAEWRVGSGRCDGSTSLQSQCLSGSPSEEGDCLAEGRGHAQILCEWSSSERLTQPGEGGRRRWRRPKGCGEGGGDLAARALARAAAAAAAPRLAVAAESVAEQCQLHLRTGFWREPDRTGSSHT